MNHVQELYKEGNVFPSEHQTFQAFKLAPQNKVKVVILGQDPYHTPGVANGLAFSTKNKTIPPSLKNIFLEIHEDIGIPIPWHGDLTHWSEQGVLLLNSILTVQEGIPLSHESLGWEKFTDKVIEKVSDQGNIVFMLWGSKAQEKKEIINRCDNLILTTTHPSPYSAKYGFFGCRHFSKCNAWLKSKGLKEIDWSVKKSS